MIAAIALGAITAGMVSLIYFSILSSIRGF